MPAHDGVEGWQQFQAQPASWNAAVIDVNMPRMNGIELARRINAAAPALPILIVTGLMTGDSDPAEEVNLPALGVRMVLRKPYLEDELLQALEEVLQPAATR